MRFSGRAARSVIRNVSASSVGISGEGVLPCVPSSSNFGIRNVGMRLRHVSIRATTAYASFIEATGCLETEGIAELAEESLSAFICRIPTSSHSQPNKRRILFSCLGEFVDAVGQPVQPGVDGVDGGQRGGQVFERLFEHLPADEWVFEADLFGDAVPGAYS